MNTLTFAQTSGPTPFHAYPTQSVIGFVSTAADAQATRTALRAAGIDDAAVGVLHGVAGARILDRTGRAHGVLARMVRWFQRATDDGALLDEADAELRAGHFLFRVYTNGTPAAKHRTQRILTAHNGHGITFYGRFTTERYASPR